MTAYYNEIDPYAARWLRNLIEAGHIAFGVVDERSIEDVRPDEIAGYTQCHLFAGIGVWSYALRLAGWPDDEPVWTGSCPCQPFSQAGKGLGFADERHLWPAWHHLISECRPATIFGEQVASKDVDPWIDLVFDDLEAMEYACAANPFPSAGVGAPHIRDRTFFVAHAYDARPQGRRGVRERSAELVARARRMAGIVADAGNERLKGVDALLRQETRGWIARDIPETSGGGEASELADSDRGQCDGLAVLRGAECDGQDARRPQGGSELESRRDVRGMADSASIGRGERSADALRSGKRSGAQGLEQRFGDVRFLGRSEPAGPTNGFWRAADWLLCRDGKWRPVEPGTFPLAHGTPARVGRLRAYGNAINAQAAKVFIESVMDCMP